MIPPRLCQYIFSFDNPSCIYLKTKIVFFWKATLFIFKLICIDLKTQFFLERLPFMILPRLCKFIFQLATQIYLKTKFSLIWKLNLSGCVAFPWFRTGFVNLYFHLTTKFVFILKLIFLHLNLSSFENSIHLERLPSMDLPGLCQFNY